jgi:ADP-heptose:LPS heptosyltransferase
MGMKILFVTATRIGDAVLSSGVLAHLIERHPEARITIVCGPDAAPLFTEVPNCQHLVRLRKQRFALHWAKLWLACVVESWDLVVDLRRTALSWFLPCKKRLIPGRNQPGVHRVRHLADSFALEAPPPPRVWTSPEHREAATRLVPEGAPVLAIAPTANWPGKVWPAEGFVELIRRFTVDGGILPNARVAIFSAPAEREAALEVLESVPAERRIDIAGTVDLLTAYACLERCALFVGNDSALMHLAAASGIPTLGLFGPSKPEHYAPWGPHTAFVRTVETYDDFFGDPDFDHRTTGSVMGGLSVEAAESAARALWQARDREGRIVRPTLSALVVAHNEELQLADCLESLRFADEIVVALDRCTDKSKSIAERCGAKIVEGAWTHEGPRRSAGIAACTGDWIFEVDADERVSPELAAEIRAALPGVAAGYFQVPVDNYVGDHLVRHGWGATWGVSSKPALFARGCKQWGEGILHASITLNGPRRWLKSRLTHFVDDDISDMFRRFERYTYLRAQDLRELNRKESLARNVRRVFTRFYKCYVSRKGYREGYYGLLIALFAGLYPLLSFLRARIEDEGGDDSR